MRMRADQVRVGYRLSGAVVTKIRPTLDWGMVRITVQNDGGNAAASMANGTFSYLPDDILDVQTTGLSTLATAGQARPAMWR